MNEAEREKVVNGGVLRCSLFTFIATCPEHVSNNKQNSSHFDFFFCLLCAASNLLYPLHPFPSPLFLQINMGRKFSKRKNAPPRKERDPNATYVAVVKENAKMEEYYKAQKIMSDEEWPVFWEHLKVTLPTTFRITGTRR